MGQTVPMVAHMARPTKLTPELQAEFAACIEQGDSIEQACDIVGIDHSTFYDWQQKAGAGSEDHAKFSEAHKRAEALYVRACIADMRHAEISGDKVLPWQRLAWLVERKRKEWRMPKEPVVSAVSLVTPEVMAELRRAEEDGT